MSKKTDNAETRSLHSLVRRAITLIADAGGYQCGNVEGTPCDDLRPGYVCKYHRWIKEARAATKAPNDPSSGAAR